MDKKCQLCGNDFEHWSCFHSFLLIPLTTGFKGNSNTKSTQWSLLSTKRIQSKCWLMPIPHNSKIIKLIHSDTQSISFEYSHLSECPEKCSLKDLTKCWLGTVSGTFSFIIHLYLWQKRGKFVCCSIKITKGKIKVTPHAAGKLAWFRDAGLILCCLTIYPSLSKLVVAEVAQLLSCLSEWLPVILLCRPRDSSDGSKEQIIFWKSICSSSQAIVVSEKRSLK